jgi:hypothetical protein
MPIPQRKQREQEDTFISRCIGELIGKGEYEQEQASAICYQQLDIQLGLSKEWRKSFLSKPEATCLTQYRNKSLEEYRK